MNKRIAAVIAAPIIGAFLGYLLVNALTNGWFTTKWQKIEKPPGEAISLAASSQDSIWVQSATGTIYYNENSSTCESDCWVEVPEIPSLPMEESDDITVTDKACAPALPISNVTERISECWKTLWVDKNYTFALKRDGNIYLWQAELFKEWTVVLLFVGVCGGAIALFIPVLFFVLLIGFLDRRSKRANKRL